MKIGILTTHEGLNHGGFFQAFSLYKTLESLGYNPYILNYKNKIHRKNERKHFFYTKNPVTLINNLIKFYRFEKDLKCFNLIPKYLTTNKIKISIISNDFDLIIVGSDIVWNFEWDFLGKDPIYFGHGIKSKKIISYAPSFGNIPISTKIPDFVIDGLTKFNFITVRDENSKQLVKKAINKNVDVVVDPTLLYDFNSLKIKRKIKQDYILIYAYFLTEEEKNQIINFAKTKNLIMISVGYSQRFVDLNHFTAGPFEWLSYFKYASYIFTSTLHGTLFSLIFSKSFYISGNFGIKLKLDSILENLDLSYRYNDNESSEIPDISKVLSTPFDSKTINEKLSKLKKNNLELLKNEINNKANSIY